MTNTPTRKYRAKHGEAGGRRLDIYIDAATASALDSLRESTGLSSDTQAVIRAIRWAALTHKRLDHD